MAGTNQTAIWSPEDQDGIDAAYHAKYDRYGPRIVGSVTGPRCSQRDRPPRPAS